MGSPGLDVEEGIEVAFCDGINVGSDGLRVVGVLLVTAVGLARFELLSAVATQLLMNKQQINNA